MLTLPIGMRAIGLAILCLASTAAAAPKLPSTYAPLFDKGHAWTYQLSLVNFDYVEKPDGSYRAVKMKPELSTFTCTVTGVVTFAEAVVSTIHCDREIDSAYSFRVDGTWVATRAGVFRISGDTDTLPASAQELTLDPPRIGAAPSARRKRIKDGYGGFFSESITSPKAGTWCGRSDTTRSALGDGAIEQVCFTAGVGISSGLLDYHGGTPRIVEYKVTKRQ